MLPEHPLTPDDPEFFFWLRHARRAQEPVAVVGEGAGRVAQALAGQEIATLLVAPEEGAAQEALTWVGGELGALRLARRVGMVALPVDAFAALLTLEAQRAALRALHEGLQLGGKLALALAVPDAVALAASLNGQVAQHALEPESGAEGTTLLRWESRRYDLDTQRVHYHAIFEEVDSTGVSLHRWHRLAERAFFWPREVRLLLELSGFEVEAVFGGWNDEPLRAISPMQVWVARKGA